MLMPRKVRHRKTQRGRMGGMAKGGTRLAFGDYGIQAIEPAWLTNRQIEAARIAMTRHIKRGGKVWIYKGEILPYKSAVEDKIAREAAMAVGETAGPTGRRVVSAGGGRRRAPAAEGAAPETPAEGGEEGEAKPLVGEADPEFERLLAEEEEIERRTRQHHETPHFRGEED